LKHNANLYYRDNEKPMRQIKVGALQASGRPITIEEVRWPR
jgi:hypothetical protein